MVFRDKKVVNGTLLTPAGIGNNNNAGTGFALAESQTNTAITDLSFGSTVRSFEALVSVFIDATTDVAEQFKLHGVYDGTDWYMTSTSSGIDTGIVFNITSGGTVQYSSGTWTGFSSGILYFHYTTTPR